MLGCRYSAEGAGNRCHEWQLTANQLRCHKIGRFLKHASNRAQSGFHSHQKTIVENHEEMVGSSGLDQFKGAGIMVFESVYSPRIEEVEMCVLLFRDRITGEYSEGGGRRDVGETFAAETACRELQEESCNLLTLTPDVVQQCEYVAQKSYVCFACHVHGIQPATFDQNHLKIASSSPSCWKEKDHLTYVPVESVRACIVRPGAVRVCDIYGKEVLLHRRCTETLRKLRLRTNNFTKLTELFLEPKQVMRDNFVEETVTYTVHASDVETVLNRAKTNSQPISS